VNLLHLSCSDSSGGAARAAYRLHRALLEEHIHSRMLVRQKATDDWTVSGPSDRRQKLINAIRPIVGNMYTCLQGDQKCGPSSGNLVPSRWAPLINASSVDVVNLHWIGRETMSIADVGNISKPTVWTLHDMWPFCGTEHIAPYDLDARWRVGYRKSNRYNEGRGFDLSGFVWGRKKSAWRTPIQFVAPSRWLADCARSSNLFQHMPVEVIPNVLNTAVFKPLDIDFCRDALGFPKDKWIILFGAIGGGSDPNKGYDLLLAALEKLRYRISGDRVLCVVFGQSEPSKPVGLPFPVRWIGHVYDDATLSLLYNAATVTVVPSRQENLPQTATEAQACGCPVVAFDTSGLPDAIAHLETGYLAQAYDIEELAKGLEWVFKLSTQGSALRMTARERALCLWSPSVVIPQYLKLYNRLITKS